MNTDPEISAIAQWFGSNRMLADEVGKRLVGCNFVAIPFGGGMCEVKHIKASTILVGDKHRHIINLAKVIASPELPQLIERLESLPFHPDVLHEAQARCLLMEVNERFPCMPDLAWAVDYFVSVWMARAGKAGTKGEFQGSPSIRWSASGGDSVTRFRNATTSMRAWQELFRPCTFVVMDAFTMLASVHDELTTGIYCDPPFPGPGDAYKFTMGDSKQELLAHTLGKFKAAKVACRFYDHPMVRRMYPEKKWRWEFLKGRKQTNEAAPEVLLTRNVGILTKASGGGLF